MMMMADRQACRHMAATSTTTTEYSLDYPLFPRLPSLHIYDIYPSPSTPDSSQLVVSTFGQHAERGPMLPGANSVRDRASSGSSQRNGRHALGWLVGVGWVPAINPPLFQLGSCVWQYPHTSSLVKHPS